VSDETHIAAVVDQTIARFGRLDLAFNNAGITSAALEYAPRGVRINAVCPGTIDTPMVDRMAGAGELDLDATLAATPMSRLGKAAEIASAVLWLCSPGASYVTGVALPVDGDTPRSSPATPSSVMRRPGPHRQAAQAPARPKTTGSLPVCRIVAVAGDLPAGTTEEA
jgi:NAD(P)-dependent dehydrogenase (short-subunit alcohol dehydrogenase family)